MIRARRSRNGGGWGGHGRGRDGRGAAAAAAAVGGGGGGGGRKGGGVRSDLQRDFSTNRGVAIIDVRYTQSAFIRDRAIY